MARRPRLPAAERRALLLEAALDVMGERGYHGTSLDEIAKAAGVSKALIYEHFDSKRDMYGALLTMHLQPLFESLEENTRTGAEGAERLTGGVDRFFAWVEERRKAYRVFVRDINDPELAELTRAVSLKATGVVADLLGADPSERRVVLLATQLFGALQSLALWWDTHPDTPRAEMVDAAMAFCWAGLAQQRG